MSWNGLHQRRRKACRQVHQTLSLHVGAGRKERLYVSLTPEDDLGLVKSLKVDRSIPDLVYDVGIDIQSYVPSPASPIERIGVPRWPRLGYFKSEDFVRYCRWFMPGDAVSTGAEHGRFVRYRKPHAGLPMCEVMVGKVLHIIREYLLEPVV